MKREIVVLTRDLNERSFPVYAEDDEAFGKFLEKLPDEIFDNIVEIK